MGQREVGRMVLGWGGKGAGQNSSREKGHVRYVRVRFFLLSNHLSLSFKKCLKIDSKPIKQRFEF
jgi:hypothetical protein